MKSHNIKTWMRFVRLKWNTDNSANNQSARQKTDDLYSIKDFDHHPTYGINPDFDRRQGQQP